MLNPTTLAILLGAAPRAEETAKRLGDRFEQYSKKIREAPYTPPGEKIVTASAHAFLEKRAALQSTEKTAAPIPTGLIGRLGTLGERLGPAAKAIEPLIGPKGLLIGGSLIGLGALGEPALKVWGEKIRQTIAPQQLHERANMDVDLANSFAKQVGKELGTKTVSLLGDFLSKTVAAPSAMFQNRERMSVFEALRNEDEVISQADPQQLAEAYHTMVRFAPTLATDKNAVKTFLRESVLYGTGPNFMSIKQLADAENAVNYTSEE